MDSLTHIIIGLSLGQVLCPGKHAWKASLVGAVVSTLPDLDIFIPHVSDVAAMTEHRGFSHSILVQALAAPVLTFAAAYFFKFIDPKTWRWQALFALSFFLHTLLDCFTIYGTRALWPFPVTVAWGSLFIVDPFFTVPVLVGASAALILRSDYGQKLNRAGLFIAACYLVWSLVAQAKVERDAHEALAAQHVTPLALKATPAPFNTVLWRVIAVTPQNYYIGYRSLLADTQPLRFSTFATQPQLLQPIDDTYAVQRLKWNTHGLFSVTREQDNLFLTDLRMGMENAYMFHFLVGRFDNGTLQAVPDKRFSMARDYSRLNAVYRRVFDERVSLE